MKTALITGISGMDGSHLAQLLLDKGYRVVGTYRRTASGSFWRLEELGVRDHENLSLVQMDLLELPRMLQVLRDTQPDEVYNLAAQSHVHTSFDQPLVTADVDAIGALRLLECIRSVCPKARFYQASSSEMFGNAPIGETGYTENSPMCPRSPYGFSKLFAYHATRNYRDAHGMFACNGILFNHESPLRSLEFVTRKITDGVARITCGENHVIKLGNLDARRDWGSAPDYVRGMWLMLQHDTPDDYVLATGETHSVREFVTAAFKAASLPFVFGWVRDRSGGEPDVEVGALTRDGIVHHHVLAVDPALYRPAEVDVLLGDASKARLVLGWESTVKFKQLVGMMVDAEIARRRLARRES